jgi:hypothetical protein
MKAVEMCREAVKSIILCEVVQKKPTMVLMFRHVYTLFDFNSLD